MQNFKLKINKISSLNKVFISFFITLSLFLPYYLGLQINALSMEKNLEIKTKSGLQKIDSNLQNTGKTAVTATRKGLIGQITASGIITKSTDNYVSLPSTRALNSRVIISYNGKTVSAGVWDVGPFNTKDDYWSPTELRESYKDLPRYTPQSQAAFENNYNNGLDSMNRKVNNPSGIDISDNLFWNVLGMTDNKEVQIQFSVNTLSRGKRVIASGMGLQQKTGGLNIRSAPAGSLISTQSWESEGVIIDGPVIANFSGVSYIWWNVKWNNGVTGWSVESMLESKDFYETANFYSTPINNSEFNSASILTFRDQTRVSAMSISNNNLLSKKNSEATITESATVKSAGELAVFNNEIYEFIWGTDDKLYWRKDSGLGFGGWNLGWGITLSDKPNTLVFANRLYLLTFGSDSRFYLKYLDEAGNWSQWQEGGGINLAATPTGAILGNQMVITAKGYDQKMYQRSLNSDNQNSVWESGRGITTLQTGNIVATPNIAIQQAVGTDKRIYYRKFAGFHTGQAVNNPNWFTWEEGSGITTLQSPYLIYNNRTITKQLVCGTDNRLYQRELFISGFSNWSFTRINCDKIIQNPITFETWVQEKNNLSLLGINLGNIDVIKNIQL